MPVVVDDAVRTAPSPRSCAARWAVVWMPARTIRQPSLEGLVAFYSVSVDGGVAPGVPVMPLTSPLDEAEAIGSSLPLGVSVGVAET